MENLKIKVNNEAESKEAQGYFEDLGAVCCSGLERNKNVNFLFMNSGFVTACKLQENFDKSKCKEITLPELCDLVVLKRNDRKDANVLEDNCHYDLYLTKSRELYFYHCGKNKWILSNLNGDDFYYELLKPIEKKEMKEYLVKSQDGKWCLETDLVGDPADNVIEVPDGAVKAYLNNSKTINFVNADDDYMNSVTDGKWIDTHRRKHEICGHTLVWQRNQEPKQAEFLVKTDGRYVLQVLDENSGGADVVRIPDGAHSFRKNLKFYNKDGSKFYHSNNYWDDSRSQFKVLWQRETLNDQVASAEEYQHPEDLPFVDSQIDIDVENLPEFKPFNNGPVEHDSTAFTNIGIEYQIKKEIKTDFPLNRGDVNYRVAKAFNEIRGTDLTEDDLDFIRKLIDLTVSHYTDRF